MAITEIFEADPKGYVELDPRVAILQDPASSVDAQQQAFFEIDLEFRPPVLGLATKLVHSAADAEEVAQETLFGAWKGIHTYREPYRPFKGWLMTITYNRAKDFHRFRGRHPQSFDYAEISEDGFRTVIDTSDTSPETQTERSILSAEIAARLKEIPLDFAIPVSLRFIDDLDYETIAQKLDIPVGTVRSRIHRGKAALKELLTFTEA